MNPSSIDAPVRPNTDALEALLGSIHDQLEHLLDDAEPAQRDRIYLALAALASNNDGWASTADLMLREAGAKRCRHLLQQLAGTLAHSDEFVAYAPDDDARLVGSAANLLNAPGAETH